MLDAWNRAEHYRDLAEECRRLATGTLSSTVANRREIAHGFAVDDAAGRQLGVFHGRDDSNTAGYTGFLTIDEARQMAVDFAGLPELLKRAAAL